MHIIGQFDNSRAPLANNTIMYTTQCMLYIHIIYAYATFPIANTVAVNNGISYTTLYGLKTQRVCIDSAIIQ